MRICHCGGTALVLRSHRNRDGTRNRRYECASCRQRWTEWEGEATPCRRKTPIDRRALDDAQLLDLLVTRANVPASELAREWGISSYPILCARRGDSYMDRLPNVPRRWMRSAGGGPSCGGCIHGRGIGCSLGVPEATIEGPRFAVECAAYQEAAGELQGVDLE